MAIACVRIPHFSLRVAILDHPELDGAPLVLRSAAERRELVADVTPEAWRLGLRPGLSLREVPSLCPEAVVCAAQPVREQAILTRLLDRLETVSPLVETDRDEPGTFYADLRGLDRHYPSPVAATRQLLAAVPPLLRPRAGIAPTVSVARFAALRAKPGACRVIEPVMVRAFLANLPLADLPAPPELHLRLTLLGLETLGEFATLSPAAVAARFGPAGRRAWDIATGQDGRQIRPRPQPPRVIEVGTFEPPLTSQPVWLLTLNRFVQRAFARPVLRDRHVRQIDIQAELEGGRFWDQRLVLRAPSGRERVVTALDLRLRDLVLPGPVTALRLELTGLGPATAQQAPLAALGVRPRQARPLVEAIQQLTQRYGVSPLFRIAEVEPWSPMPERRFALMPYAP